MGLNLILTGATGMVGEGVLFECLKNENVDKILIVGRQHYDMQHEKIEELLVPDFSQSDKFQDELKGYDGCLFCAGVSSVGMNEQKYTHITYDTTLAFARSVSAVNNNATFCYVSGAYTDSTEKGKIMWARVKGRTENDLMKLPFKGVYNFRPGAMMPFDGQKNWKWIYKQIVKIIRIFSRNNVLTMEEVGRAMINVCKNNYSKHVLEIKDIKALGA